ncbi:hypothetical protein H0H93_006522, partial [Arthromyces matolae]
VMSLLDKFSVVVKDLSDIHDAISRLHIPQRKNNLLRWVYEGRQFAMQFREPVQRSASHIYHSALPLSPLESILHKSHSKALESEVKILLGRSPAWSSADMFFAGFIACSHLHFSNTGKLLAITHSRRLSVYDTTSGVVLHTFDGERISFSPDDTIASVLNLRDGTVRLHDLRTGTYHCVCHEGAYYHAISPGGTFLAIMSKEHKISIWNILSGKQEWEFVTQNSDPLVDQFQWLQENPPRIIILTGEALKVLDIVSGIFTSVLWCKGLTFLSVSLLWRVIGIVAHDQLQLLCLESYQKLSSLQPLEPYQLVPRAYFSPLQRLLVWEGHFFDITDPSSPYQVSALPPTGQYTLSFSPMRPFFAVSFPPWKQVEILPTSNVHLLRPPQRPIYLKRPLHFGETCWSQFFSSSDGNDVLASKIFSRGHPGQEAFMLHFSGDGVTQTPVDVIPTYDYLWRKRSLQNIIASCQAGLHEMEGIGIHWHCLNPALYERFWLVAPQNKTLVHAELSEINNADSDTTLILTVTVYALGMERILARGTWALLDKSGGFKTSSACYMDMISSTGVLTIFVEVQKPLAYQISPKDVMVEEQMSETDKDSISWYNLDPMSLDTFARIDANLGVTYSAPLSTLEYPVVKSSNWIINAQGKNILWTPRRLQQEGRMHWCRDRLFIADDTQELSFNESFMVADFSDVSDAKVPTPQQVFDMLGWNRIVISGFDKLKENEGSDSVDIRGCDP